MAATATDVLLEHYGRYLLCERGLAAGTVWDYTHAVRPFLEAREAIGGLGLEELTAVEVTEFVVARCPRQARGSAKLTVTALRSLLGYLHLVGVIPRPLVGAVPSAASWRWPVCPGRLSPPRSGGCWLAVTATPRPG